VTERTSGFRARPGLIALLLFVLCLGCYLANGRTVPQPVGGDTIPNRLVPFSILGFGTLALDPFREDFAAGGGPPWYTLERGGRLISLYPVGTPLVALPFYAPTYLSLRVAGRVDHASLFRYSEQAEKLAASAMAALSVALFYLIVRRRVAPSTALGSSVAFGLASSVWATASQMLWQHGAVVLALTLALLFLTWPGRPHWSVAGAGFALALGVITRPTVLVLYLGGLGCQILVPDRPRAKLSKVTVFLLAGVPLLVFDAIFGGTFYNSSLGGYTGLQLTIFAPSKFLLGLGGVLVSPNRGLFVFMPAAVLGFYGLWRGSLQFLRERRDPLFPLFGLAVTVHLLAVASYGLWGGGWAFGPRYLVCILPVLALAGTEAWPSLSRTGKRLTTVALVWSVLVQLNGAFCYPASQWNARAGNQIERQAWNPFRFELWEDFRAWRAQGRIAAHY
jgi:hypothetical protein